MLFHHVCWLLSCHIIHVCSCYFITCAGYLEIIYNIYASLFHVHALCSCIHISLLWGKKEEKAEDNVQLCKKISWHSMDGINVSRQERRMHMSANKGNCTGEIPFCTQTSSWCGYRDRGKHRKSCFWTCGWPCLCGTPSWVCTASHHSLQKDAIAAHSQNKFILLFLKLIHIFYI